LACVAVKSWCISTPTQSRLLNKITAVDNEETNAESQIEANEASDSESCETDSGTTTVSQEIIGTAIMRTGAMVHS